VIEGTAVARSLFRFDPDKALEAILYLAMRVPDPTFHRISKLMYFADKAHLANYGRLIFGDSYVAMKHGPVPSEVYDILKAVRGDGLSSYLEAARQAFCVDANKQVIPLLDVFSASDLECMDEAIRAYGHLSFKELTTQSHDAAWEAVDENDVMDVEQIIATLPDGPALLAHLRQDTSA
jgi:uncharacterized phage-associated protein